MPVVNMCGVPVDPSPVSYSGADWLAFRDLCTAITDLSRIPMKEMNGTIYSFGEKRFTAEQMLADAVNALLIIGGMVEAEKESMDRR